MKRALAEYRVEGIETTIPFFTSIMDNADFRAAKFDTGFIDRWLRERQPRETASETERDLALIAAALSDALRAPTTPPDVSPEASSWKTDGRIRGLRR